MISGPRLLIIISKMPCDMLVSVEIRISTLKYTPVRPGQRKRGLNEDAVRMRSIKSPCNRDSPLIVLGVATGTNGSMKSINK